MRHSQNPEAVPPRDKLRPLGRSDKPKSAWISHYVERQQLSGKNRTRQPLVGAASFDPQRHFATVK